MQVRKLVILGLLCGCLWPALQAQRLMEMRDKSFNFGAKVGLNSIFPYFTELTLDGTAIEKTYASYQVGYQASLFCRFNKDRFFIQPSLTWQHGSSEIAFFYDSPVQPAESSDQNPTYTTTACNLAISSNSFEVPVLFGYHLVRQAPYGLSLMAGPKLRYIYRERYKGTTETDQQPYLFEEESRPFTVNLATGVSVTIGRLFFDFTYEFGLPQTSHFTAESKSLPDESHKLFVKRHTNVLNYSLGFLF